MPLYCDRSCRDAAYWRRKHRWHDPHNDLLRDYHALEECHRALWQRYEDLDESYKELWTDYQEACHELARWRESDAETNAGGHEQAALDDAPQPHGEEPRMMDNATTGTWSPSKG
jgi:hypothetical protein